VQERIWCNSLLIFSNSAWFMDALFHPEEARNAFFEMLILCSGQKMIPARNAIVAHAHSYLVNDELLLPIQKTHEIHSFATRSSKYLTFLSVPSNTSITVCHNYR
jgi:hypothetical protein